METAGEPKGIQLRRAGKEFPHVRVVQEIIGRLAGPWHRRPHVYGPLLEPLGRLVEASVFTTCVGRSAMPKIHLCNAKYLQKLRYVADARKTDTIRARSETAHIDTTAIAIWWYSSRYGASAARSSRAMVVDGLCVTS